MSSETIALPPKSLATFRRYGAIGTSGTVLVDGQAQLNHPVIDGHLKRATFDFRNIRGGESEMLSVLMDTAPAEALVRERDGSVRSCFGVHLIREEFAAICLDPQITSVASQIVGSDVSLYQSHLNFKGAKGGGDYSLHRDALYFQHRDGVRDVSAMVGVAVALGEITESMGPLVTLLGSHNDYEREPLRTIPVPTGGDLRHDSPDDPGVVNEETVTSVGTHVFTSARRLDCVYFDPRGAHYSGANAADKARPMLLLFFAPRHVFPGPADNKFLHEAQ